MFVTCDDSLSSLTHDDISEIKERLLDSLATLNLLKDDTEKEESHLQSITGVAGPAESILDHLNNICTCVTHLVYLLTDLLESHNADGTDLSSVNEGSVSYAAPVSQSDQQYSGIGRRKKKLLVISWSILEVSIFHGQKLQTFYMLAYLPSRVVVMNLAYRYMYLKIAWHLKTYIDTDSSVDFEKLH